MYWNIGSTKWGGNQKDLPAEAPATPEPTETVPAAEKADVGPAPAPAELFTPAEQAVKEVVIEINDRRDEDSLKLLLPMPPVPKGEEQV